MAFTALPALTGDHCLNTGGGIVALLHLLFILPVALLGMLTGMLPGVSGILTGVTGIHTGVTGILLLAVLAIVGVVGTVGTVGTVATVGTVGANLVLSCASTVECGAVLLLLPCSVTLLLPLQPHWCRAMEVFILLPLLLFCSISPWVARPSLSSGLLE